MDLQKGDILYYSRILENVGEYDVYELKIRTVADNWFVGVDKRDKQAFLFSKGAIDKIIFKDRLEAVMKAKEAQDNGRVISNERDNERDNESKRYF